MRPVERGDDPSHGGWDPYSRARNDLAQRLGWACSFCEAPLKIGIQVEHKLPKSHHPHLTHSWTNFLLACVHCNARKGHPGDFTLDDVLWPDRDNTFRVFAYSEGGQVAVRDGLDRELCALAEDTRDMVGLDNIPAPGSSDRDLRFFWREQAWEKAVEARAHLAGRADDLVRRYMVKFAVETGFFSVWMTVFGDDVDMRRRLLHEFQVAPGCFDADTQETARAGGRC